MEHQHGSVVQADDYYPYGLSFNQAADRSLKNKYLYNGGSEWQDKLGLNWYSTMNRPYDPALGRFFGIDALSDLMPSVSPMAFAYNNPVFFYDPLGLAGIPGCDECEGTPLPEIVITAPRIKTPATDYSWLLNSLSQSSNPIYRNIGLQYQRGNYDYLSQAFSQTPIQYGEGLGYQTEFMQGLRTIGAGVSTGLIYASFGVMAAPIVAYGAPVLYQAIAGSGAFSLSGTLGTNAILTRVGIEAGTQTIGNVMTRGMSGFGEIDVADVVLSGTGLNFVGSSLIGASVDWTPFSSSTKYQSIVDNKTFKDFTIDLGTGLTLGGTNNLMNNVNTNKLVIGLFNVSVTTGSNEMKRNE